MLVLAIETATAWGSVAVVGPQGLLVERAAHVPGGHLEWLLPAIDAALADAGLRREAIEGLVVSRGPGGFSGLRIGIATAAAWAHAAGRPLVAVSTLEVMAEGASASGLVLAALDARRGEIAGAVFRRGGAIQRVTPDFIAPPAALRDCLGASSEPVAVTGDALERHAAAIVEALGPRARLLPRAEWFPRASVAGALGRARLVRGERDDPLGLVPIYVRSQAVQPYPA
ncbi:MAG: tRNA (adenosine(37)-N6)-threonylcarbamoyltransferase complex dimerization subunit type 1 TsaB [Armatimonadota bacterium]|nr:tRNA (adenosine(37)-N6)-threonylcarbamoyltransferase complex dimerization subunit type 1 TsaB [Armatimonadota bacterium]